MAGGIAVNMDDTLVASVEFSEHRVHIYDVSGDALTLRADS